MDREYILRLLHAQVNINGHIVGAAVGSGMTAKYAVMGGSDFVMALSAGKYRVMGRSSYASYFCYGNSNQTVMELGTRELLPVIQEVPVLFGLFASDPEIHLYEYLKMIKENGFSGIVNYPTMSLIDGKFRIALEEEGNTYQKEVEAIRLAHYYDLFTVAFVTNAEESELMIEAGADVICAHLGLTKGGYLGAKNVLSIQDGKKLTDEIFEVCMKKNPDALRMIYAGPASTSIDMQYMYQNTACQGYIGGSTFERIPVERAIYNTTKAFKSYGSLDENDPMMKMINGNWNPGDYTEFVKKYIEEHYMNEIKLADLALVAHVTPSYLSTKFKKETGISFTEYLVRHRIRKAKKLIKSGNSSFKEVADAVGYHDYVQFSKMFKKYAGVAPSIYRQASFKTE